MANRSNYDKFPFVTVDPSPSACSVGWEAITAQLRKFCDKQRNGLLYVSNVIWDALSMKSSPSRTHNRDQDSLQSPNEIDAMLDPYLGGDPVFGRMNGTAIEDFLDPKLVAHAKSAMVNIERGLILIVGTGAFLVSPDPSVLIYADMARWEIQRRQRQNLIANLGVSNEVESASLKYKRAFFVDWRAADRLKKQLLPSIDFLLDTNDSGCHKMISGATLRAGLKKVVGQPFRLVPYFDPGPWGGQAGNPPTDECSSSDTGPMINEYNGVWMDEGPEILLLTSFCSRRALRLGPYFPTY